MEEAATTQGGTLVGRVRMWLRDEESSQHDEDAACELLILEVRAPPAPPPVIRLAFLAKAVKQ